MSFTLDICEAILVFASLKKQEFAFLLLPLSVFISCLEYRDKKKGKEINLWQFSRQLGITFSALLLVIDYLFLGGLNFGN